EPGEVRRLAEPTDRKGRRADDDHSHNERGPRRVMAGVQEHDRDEHLDDDADHERFEHETGPLPRGTGEAQRDRRADQTENAEDDERRYRAAHGLLIGASPGLPELATEDRNERHHLAGVAAEV